MPLRYTICPRRIIDVLRTIGLPVALLGLIALIAPTPSTAKDGAQPPAPPAESADDVDGGPSPSDFFGDPGRNESADIPSGESVEDERSSSVCECQNEIWQINTRHLPACTANPTPRVYQFDEAGTRCWHPRTLEELLEPYDGIVVVYVHGNRMEAQNTLNRGMMYYRCLTNCGGPKVRFIIWSWPSQQIHGQLKDIRVKAHRADYEGVYVAWFLNKLPEDATLSLIGYSYGARVLANTMHLFTHGGTRKMALSRQAPMRTVFSAPAMANCDLSRGGRYRGAMNQVDRMLMMYNSQDPILKRYSLVVPHSHPQALGYTGLRSAIPGGTKIRQIDVAPVVGRSHYEPRYMQNSGLLAEMRRCLLWQEMP